MLERSLHWRAASGHEVKLRTRRLVSFSLRSLAAIEYEVEAVDRPIRVAIQSNLQANKVDAAHADDPRQAPCDERRAPAAALRGPRHARGARPRDQALRARRWRPGMEHVLEHDGDVSTLTQSEPDLGRVTLSAELEPGRPLRAAQAPRLPLVLPAERGLAPRPGGREPRERAGRGLRRPGRGAARDARPLLAARRRGGGRRPAAPAGAALRDVPHLPGRGRNEGRAIPAKGLTGSGYDGHAFWDTESFVLPVLTFTAPQHRPPRARVAPLHARLGARAGSPARAARGGPALAHHPRRGVLGLLAGGHGRLPRERRRGRRRAPLRDRHRRPRVRASAPAASCWWRARGCGRASATTTSAGTSGSTA